MADDDNTISIKVTATTDDLERGLNKATGEVKTFGDEINNLAQRVQAVKPDAFKELAQQFNTGKLDLDEFRDGLIATTTASSAAATEAKALATSTGISSSAMREFTVIGRELASGNLTRLPGSLSLLASRLGGIPPGAILATAAIVAFGYAIYEVIDSSEKFEADLAKIQNAFAATGSGGAFDNSQLAGFIADLRQIPGVTDEAATAIANDFARTRNSSEIFPELLVTLKPFSELIGKDVPQAAKEMATSFDDPVRGLKLLQQTGVEVSATQQEQIREMMAVNDVAGAQRVLFDALNTSYVGLSDTFTSHQYFWQNLRNILGGVSEDANRTKQALEGLAAAYPMLAGVIATNGEKFATRNLPNQQWSGSSGSVASDDQKVEAGQHAEEQKKLNDAINDGMQLYDKGNSPLREQEEHLSKISRLQSDLNAATNLGNADAAQKIQAQIDQENKLYAQRMKRQEPKPDKTDTDFNALIDEQSQKYERDQERSSQIAIDSDEKSAAARLATERDLIQEKAALGEISSDQQLKQLDDIAAQELAVEKAKFDQLAALYANDSDKQKELAADRVAAEQKYDQQIIQLRTRAAEQNQKTDNGLTQSVTRGLNQTVDNVLRGTQTMNQAFQRLGQNIVLSVVNNALDKIVTQFIANNATIQAVQSALNSFLDITNTENAADSVTTASTAAHANITSYAAEGAAAAIASTAAIPLIGPELAPEAGAGIYADIMSFNIASAAGGMVVDSDQIAKVHENEMILPAHLSQGIAGMIANGSGGGGNHTFHNNFNINAGDGVTAKQLPDMIVKTMTKAMRNGQFGSMRS